MLVAYIFLTVKRLTDHHFEFLSLKGGCTGLSKSKLVKMPHRWKTHFGAQILYLDKTVKNPAFELSDQVILKLACTFTETRVIMDATLVY